MEIKTWGDAIKAEALDWVVRGLVWFLVVGIVAGIGWAGWLLVSLIPLWASLIPLWALMVAFILFFLGMTFIGRVFRRKASHDR